MPRLLLATVAALALAAPAQAITFNYTGSIVTWTVPEDGFYDIVAVGAQGGAGTTPIGQQYSSANGVQTYTTQVTGGRGALIGAQFELTGGTVLQIAVGGMGQNGTGSFGGSGGGGGGSFVVAPGDTPLVVAGGGGGVDGTALRNGWDASTGQIGVTGSTYNPVDAGVIGGGDPFLLLSTLGSGGPKASGLSRGPGGGGFYGDGENDNGSGGGASWPNGLVGGAGCAIAPPLNWGGGAGGFGGGGGTGGSTCFSGGEGSGGGGGYSGGQGGAAAGGGGSFWNSFLTGTRWFEAGVGTGNGSVSITAVGAEEVSTPEPASATLSLLGLFGLAAIRRRR